MIFEDVAAIKDELRPGRRVLGLDLGAKTVGLALSDPSRLIASPFETLRRSKFAVDADRLAAICAENDVGALVLGLPINMNGSEGPRCQSTRQFAKSLSARLPLPILLWDERLSTAAVTRTLLEADMSRKRRAEVVDKMAAAYILQGALDALGRLEKSGPG